MLPWKGGEFEPDLPLVLELFAHGFFWALQGLRDSQDRVLLLLVNKSLKRVFTTSLKMSLWHISL